MLSFSQKNPCFPPEKGLNIPLTEILYLPLHPSIRAYSPPLQPDLRAIKVGVQFETKHHNTTTYTIGKSWTFKIN